MRPDHSNPMEEDIDDVPLNVLKQRQRRTRNPEPLSLSRSRPRATTKTKTVTTTTKASAKHDSRALRDRASGDGAVEEEDIDDVPLDRLKQWRPRKREHARGGSADALAHGTPHGRRHAPRPGPPPPASPRAPTAATAPAASVTRHVDLLRGLDRDYARLRGTAEGIERLVRQLQHEEATLRLALQQSSTSLKEQREETATRVAEAAAARLEQALMLESDGSDESSWEMKAESEI